MSEGRIEMVKPYYEDSSVQIFHADCRDVLPTLDKVDLVLTDPPYGTTGNEWDMVMPMGEFWGMMKSISPAQIVFCSQPFTTDLIAANREAFKYCWVWNKSLAGNAILAKVQPLKIHEDVAVFGVCDYTPVMRKGSLRSKGGITDKHGTFNGASSPVTESNEYYPVSIIDASGGYMRSVREHPTQKPVEVVRFLIENYHAQTILDPFMGSGTTLRAAKDLGRKAIGIEREESIVR
jgi:site-specific DNA-methyltransferase (adenine-specific)